MSNMTKNLENIDLCQTLEYKTKKCETSNGTNSLKKHIYILGAIVLLSCVAVAILSVFGISFTHNVNVNNTNKSHPNYLKNFSFESVTHENLSIIRRSEWLAQPPVKTLKLLKHPIQYIIILNTQTENCTTKEQCILHTKYIQSYHLEAGLQDIKYNFLVGGDGRIYEGRSWNYQGEHTDDYNSRSLGIAFIGTFNEVKPAEKQLLAAKQIISFGVANRYVSWNYKLLVHRGINDTHSPGMALYDEIRTWNHWITNL